MRGIAPPTPFTNIGAAEASVLCQAGDGDFYALAQWPSRNDWLARNHSTEADPIASQQMRDAIDHAYAPVELEVAEDLLREGEYRSDG